MFKEKQVALTSFMKINSKTITAICLFLIVGIFIVACKREAGSFTGYIGETWFEFPADQYTFMASVKQQDDRQVIADVLWGFKYPSMQPLLQDSTMRGAFIGDWVNTDWVAVGIEYKQAKFDLNRGVNNVVNEIGSKVGLRDNDRYVIEKQINEYGLYHAYLMDTKKYKGAIGTTLGQNVYWAESNGNTSTFISCKNHGRVPGAHCAHKTVDNETNVVVNLSYDSKFLPQWKDIQSKTLTILRSFSKNKK